MPPFPPARAGAAQEGGGRRASGMQRRQEEEEDDEEEEEGGPESALAKSPFQLTAADVYDISHVVGRDLLQLGGPAAPAALPRLQFRIVRVLEMLEALVSRGPGPEPEPGGSAQQLGPDKMVIDLTDPERPRFTLQELREVLQERNQLKAQLLVLQEELQCYKSGIISQRRDQTEKLETDSSSNSPGTSKEHKDQTVVKRLFSFKKHGK